MKDKWIRCGWIVTVGSLVSVANASAGVVTAGIDDGFLGPSEPATPSASLIALVGSVTKAFDAVQNNNNVGHTFGSLPVDLTSASLTFRARGNPGTATNPTLGDGILLSFVDSPTTDYQAAIVWSRTFGATGSNGSFFTDNDPGLLLPGSTWMPASEVTTTLDLAALPLAGGGTLNLLPEISSRGFLDVVAGDDSAVDFFELSYTTTSVPEPTSWLCLLLGCMVSCVRRRRVFFSA